MDEARDQGSAGSDSVPPTRLRRRRVGSPKLEPNCLLPVAGQDSLWAVNQVYGVPGYPSVLLIDPKGVVRKGAVRSQALEGACAGEEGLSMVAHTPSLVEPHRMEKPS